MSRWERLVPFYRCAAVAIGIAGLSFLAIQLFHSSPTKTLTPPPTLAASQPPADRCITLPDGSKVLLHKTAQLGDTRGFTQNTRELTLTGEAYFDIRHDARPFIVHTGPIRTIVLGTAFNIDATNGRSIVITVIKGKVKVENGKGEYSILHRNEQLLVDSLDDRLQKIPVNAEALAWKKTYLLFNDVTMAEAMTELGGRYHLGVEFTNPAAANCPVTASFIRGESLEEMVRVLARINNMEYSISRDRITIRGEGCN